jgi:hypothetical protein
VIQQVKEVVLYSDATPKRFAIATADGQGVWYGDFLQGHEHAAAAEMDAAKKAVWMAVQAGANRLVLRVDAEWLTWANATDGKGGKAKALRWYAEDLGVDLVVEHVSGRDNPADRFTRQTGWREWQAGLGHVRDQVYERAETW